MKDPAGGIIVQLSSKAVVGGVIVQFAPKGVVREVGGANKKRAYKATYGVKSYWLLPLPCGNGGSQ